MDEELNVRLAAIEERLAEIERRLDVGAANIDAANRLSAQRRTAADINGLRD